MSYSTSSSSTVRSTSSTSSTLFDQLPAYLQPSYNNNGEPRTSRRHALSAPAAFTSLNEKEGHKSVVDNYHGAGVAYKNLTSTFASPTSSAASPAKFDRDEIGNLKSGHGYIGSGYRDYVSATEKANFTSTHPSPTPTFTLVDKHDTQPSVSKFSNYAYHNEKQQNETSSKKSSRSCAAALDFSYRNVYTTATGTAGGSGSGGRAKMGTPMAGPAACQLM